MVPVTLGRSEDNFTEVVLPAGVPATTPFVTDGAYSCWPK
jgi:cobalt-zinc-cadmium efflux system membrane fusion protein